MLKLYLLFYLALIRLKVSNKYSSVVLQLKACINNGNGGAAFGGFTFSNSSLYSFMTSKHSRINSA